MKITPLSSFGIKVTIFPVWVASDFDAEIWVARKKVWKPLLAYYKRSVSAVSAQWGQWAHSEGFIRALFCDFHVACIGNKLATLTTRGHQWFCRCFVSKSMAEKESCINCYCWPVRNKYYYIVIVSSCPGYDTFVHNSFDKLQANHFIHLLQLQFTTSSSSLFKSLITLHSLTVLIML